MAQEETPHTLPGDPAVVLQILAGADELAQRFLGRGGDANRDELAGSVETGEVTSIRAIGLEPHARALGNESGRDDVTSKTEGTEQSLGAVASRPGFVADPKRRGIAEANRQVADCFAGVGDHPLVAARAAGSEGCHRDRILVHVQPDVCNAVHNRSLSVCGSLRDLRGQSTVYADGPAVS